MADSPAPADPRARLKRRQCQSCGMVMPADQLRQRAADGRYLCPHCVASGVQPEWAKSAAGAPAAWVVGRHLQEGHGWDDERLRAVGPQDLPDHHAELHDPRNRDVLSPPRHSHQAGLRAQAHESADDSVLSHCPWDGSGQLMGSPDGTVSCGFCGRSFTVRLQPAFPAIPQTDPATGMPLGAPGDPAMAGSSPGVGQGAPVAPGAAQPPATPPQPLPADPRQQMASSVHRLALRCSPDPPATLAQILGERRG